MSGKETRSRCGYRMADIYIDVGTRQVRRGDTVLQFPGLTFDLLLALVRRAPNVVTSGELMSEVWAGRVVNDETVAKRVELVRDALGDDSREARYIAVVRGRGYRVIAAVEAVDDAAPLLPTRDRYSPQRSRRVLPIALAALLIAVAAGAWWLWPRDAAQPSAQIPPRMPHARRWPYCRWTICPPASPASTSPTACMMR